MNKELSMEKRIAKTSWWLLIIICLVLEALNFSIFGGLGYFFDIHHHHLLSNISMCIWFFLFAIPSYYIIETKSNAKKILSQS